MTNDDSGYIKIEERYGKGLDMRTVVGHITRNIRIMGNYVDDVLGGHL